MLARSGGLVVLVLLGLLVGCGSKSGKSGSSTGGAGASGDAFGNATIAGTGGAGTGGSGSGAAGTAAAGGAGTQGLPAGDGGTFDGSLGPIGTQPVGSVCVNDQNCSQAQGAAVCCMNECALASMCSRGQFLACKTRSDCAAYGGGKVCCDVPGMRFCTKPSACTGQQIP
jgi:hypothetical protein